MASVDTLSALGAHPQWLPPRSDCRVFLGRPGAPEATKTVVEPGNSFSPGMYTFGVTWWLRLHTGSSGATFFAPERAPLEKLRWRWEEGFLPLLHCDVQLDDLSIRHSLLQPAGEDAPAVDATVQLVNTGAQAVRLELFLALRSLGPAGGPVGYIALGDEGTACVDRDGRVLLSVSSPPDAAGCGVGDPSPLAMRGEVPPTTKAADDGGWCYALLKYELLLGSGDRWQLQLRCPLQPRSALRADMPSKGTTLPDGWEARRQAHLDWWRSRLETLRVDVPDARFREAFHAGLVHMLTAMVGDQVRISPLFYPLPWLRDGVFIMRCLDLAGMHDIAWEATEFCSRHDFFGGFGAEGDAPGQGIWAIVQHYRLTHDLEWLRAQYPAIRRKVEWLLRMRRADTPIRVTTDTPVLAKMQAEAHLGVICLPAAHGLIMGNMDHAVSYSIGWVNHWAICGLREAAYAASELGQREDASTWKLEAEQLWASLQKYAEEHPELLTMERTLNSMLWPCHVWEGHAARQQAAEAIDAYWRRVRTAEDGSYLPEPYWLYFEAAQAHNALLLGQREKAWQVLDYRLSHQDLPGLYGWREGGEGVGTENATDGVTLIPHLRGCQRVDSIAPHGWTQAELWLLQRAMLLEEMEAELLLFAGVPRGWLQPGGRVSFHDLPSWYGRVSAELEVQPDGRSVHIKVRGADAHTRVRISLPGAEAVLESPGRDEELRTVIPMQDQP
ncbi:hypothetical protein Tter_1988 [Thermobaculum terrenum ATCC BAA-798]|uniref:Uncharacterized protein n=1 Tax=Thermobaculum terrenum (strain ATCC BAA-798 / CCMEE 7001 / YNP1) TaxID=525904 RepID=D1CGM1_THET1|nr:hypothetical protein [Thermobaculum terrenum]ACZ42892.1 hypothetical protein Tter_1988 [Thermobaculum terrenum ATCC BAA-798]